MKTILPALALAALTTASSAPASAAELKRKAPLGIGLSPAPGGGVRVDRLMPGATAEAIGLRTGDIVVSVGAKPVTAVTDVTRYAATLHGNDPVRIGVSREGRQMTLQGKAKSRPLESYANATVDYGAVAFRDGHIRDILVMPANAKNAPVVFLIPGYGCGSIEPVEADHTYRRLGEELLARGIGYYRAEKLGSGDSTGSLKCAEIDNDTEVAGFRAAYHHLTGPRGISADRVFILGHSLGGIQAPVVAAGRPPRGIAVYGTVVRNWADYHHDVDATQAFLMNGTDPVEMTADAERNRDLFRMFYFERKSPAEIVAARQDYAETLRGLFSWDGRTHVFGRDYRLAQQLAHIPLAAAWKAVPTNVLALYGETDIVALNDEDHRLLADMADQWRPGSGRFVEVPKTDHGMTLVGDRKTFREKVRAANGVPPIGSFNPAVADALASWIHESMAKPPVRTTAVRS